MDIQAYDPSVPMNVLNALENCDHPLFPIGVVAERLGVSDQTLRLYEVKGLVKPARRNGERYYSMNDVQWLTCLRRLIHGEKVSIEGIRMLLQYAPCWEIARLCSREVFPCGVCTVYWKSRQLEASGQHVGEADGQRAGDLSGVQPGERP